MATMLTRRVNELTHSHAYKSVLISMMLYRGYGKYPMILKAVSLVQRSLGKTRMITKHLASILPLNITTKEGILVFYATLSFTWNVITQSGNPTRYVPVNDLVIKKAIKQNKSADKTRETLQARQLLESHIQQDFNHGGHPLLIQV